ncbi:MAG: hypothetical protein OXR66_04580 [Candidatus Woesearchaeota archaeon]|nr:hypothetical protein [Candidatus Woesearchaeota archaeon]
MNTEIFEQLGLTQGEIKTYLALLQTGPSSTGPIAKVSGVSRSKLYIILDKLEKRGMVSHVEEKGVLKFQAAQPGKITDYIERKKDELTQLEKNFQQFLPELEAYYDEKSNERHVAIYQGLKGIQTAHEHVYEKLTRGECYHYFGIPPAQPDAHHAYWNRDHLKRIEAGVSCKLLFNIGTPAATLENRNGYKGCDARYMPVDTQTPSYFMIYKDTVMIAIPSIHPIAVEIVSQEIADAFMAYFDEFWKKSRRFTKKKSKKAGRAFHS